MYLSFKFYNGKYEGKFFKNLVLSNHKAVICLINHHANIMQCKFKIFQRIDPPRTSIRVESFKIWNMWGKFFDNHLLMNHKTTVCKLIHKHCVECKLKFIYTTTPWGNATALRGGIWPIDFLFECI